MSALVVPELVKFMKKFRGGRGRGGGGGYWKLLQRFPGIFLTMSYDLIILIRKNDCCLKIFDGFPKFSLLYVAIDSIFLQM